MSFERISFDDTQAPSMNEASRSMRRSARDAAVVMGATFASRLLGFVKMAVIGAVFGAGARADVLHLVFVIPNNLRKLLVV